MGANASVIVIVVGARDGDTMDVMIGGEIGSGDIADIMRKRIGIEIVVFLGGDLGLDLEIIEAREELRLGRGVVMVIVVGNGLNEAIRLLNGDGTLSDGGIGIMVTVIVIGDVELRIRYNAVSIRTRTLFFDNECIVARVHEHQHEHEHDTLRSNSSMSPNLHAIISSTTIHRGRSLHAQADLAST